MALGIRPTVDFAFKRIFGSPENDRALVGLLNAILELREPITAVQILNPSVAKSQRRFMYCWTEYRDTGAGALLVAARR
jgi:hypothetical protein